MLDLSPRRRRPVFFLTLLILVALLNAPAVTADVPAVLLEDVAPEYRLENSQPFGFFDFDGVVVFSARDPQHGRELWRTDGTAEGTRLIADLCPGPCDGSPSKFVTAGGLLYFGAYAFAGRELWVSDGTAEGTRMLRDVCPGSCLGVPSPLALGDGVVFTASGAERRELWASDGTTAGTRRLFGGDGAAEVEQSITRLDDAVLFGARGALWMTDGTPEGTVELIAVREFGPGPLGLTTSGDLSFFHFGDREVWASDGTAAGTRRIATVFADNGQIGDDPSFAPLGNLSYFKVSGFSNFNQTCELWQTDGSAAGTRRVTGLPGKPGIRCLNPMLSHAGQLYFGLLTDDEGTELWTSDGTAAGTRLILDLLPGAGWGFLGGFDVVGDDLFFLGRSGPTTVWTTDGTAAGTFPVLEPPPNHRDTPARRVGDRWYFAGQGGMVDRELFVTDLTPEGTRPLANLAADVDRSDPRAFVSHQGRAFLNARRSDPDVGFRQMVLTTEGHPGDVEVFLEGHADEGAVLGDRLMLNADGLQIVHPGLPGVVVQVPELSRAEGLTAIGDRLYFAGDGGEGSEPWRSDGTVEGTEEIADLFPGEAYIPIAPPFMAPNSSFPSDFVALGDGILFVAATEEAGRELWRSDEEGPELLVDLRPGFVSSSPAELTVLGDLVLFVASREDGDRELWVTDGTAEGTRLLADLEGGPEPSRPVELTVFDDAVYFFTGTDAFVERARLWRSDGTAEGTELIDDLAADGPAQAHSLTVAGDRLYFAASTPATGFELWVSDGTPAGTAQLVDLWPGPAGSVPTDLTEVDGALLFAASDGAHGVELWRTRGTPVSTVRLTDVAPGPRSSTPADLLAVGDRLVFGAAEETHGREPWSVALGGLADCAPERPGEVLCLRGDRFEVEVDWRNFDGETGAGRAVPFHTSDAGLFTFFDEDNWEILVKVIDACSFNDRFWVLTAGATNVGYDVTVTDRLTGVVHEVANPLGQRSPSRIDVEAFDTCGVGGPLPAPAPAAPAIGGPDVSCPVDGDPGLCLHDGRFRITLAWRDFEGRGGLAEPAGAASDHSGLFYIFDEANWEVMVKIVDGCDFNDRFWVLGAAATNVEYTLTVTDQVTGESRVYDNPLGRNADAILDVDAFSACSL